MSLDLMFLQELIQGTNEFALYGLNFKTAFRLSPSPDNS